MKTRRGLETNFDNDDPVTQPLANHPDYVSRTVVVDKHGSRYTLHSIETEPTGDKTCGNIDTLTLYIYR